MHHNYFQTQGDKISSKQNKVYITKPRIFSLIAIRVQTNIKSIKMELVSIIFTYALLLINTRK